MTVHYLKTLECYFQQVKQGNKPFEVRKDDRGFQKGDVLVLLRYGNFFPVFRFGKGRESYGTPNGEPTDNPARAEQLFFKITFILTGGQYGIEPGYVVIGMKQIRSIEEGEA